LLTGQIELVKLINSYKSIDTNLGTHYYIYNVYKMFRKVLMSCLKINKRIIFV